MPAHKNFSHKQYEAETIMTRNLARFLCDESLSCLTKVSYLLNEATRGLDEDILADKFYQDFVDAEDSVN